MMMCVLMRMFIYVYHPLGKIQDWDFKINTFESEDIDVSVLILVEIYRQYVIADARNIDTRHIDFGFRMWIGSGQGPFVTLEQNGLWQSL